MATPLDLNLLRYFSPIFTWLLIFVVIYAATERSKLLGEKASSLNFIAAISLATLSVFYTKITTLIEFVAPWLIFIFIFLFLLFMGLMFLGFKQEDVWKNLSIWTVLIISFIIILIGISQTYSDVFSPYKEDGSSKSISGEAQKAIFNPRVLGSIFLLIIIALSVRLIGQKF